MKFLNNFNEDKSNIIIVTMLLPFSNNNSPEKNNNTLQDFNNKFSLDGMDFDEPSANLFSFNNPYGACPTCEGYSQVLGIDENLVIPIPTLSVYDGAVAPWKGEKLVWWKDQFVKEAGKNGFPIHQPINKLTKEQYKQLWKGTGKALGIDDFFADVEAHLYKVQLMEEIIEVLIPL